MAPIFFGVYIHLFRSHLVLEAVSLTYLAQKKARKNITFPASARQSSFRHPETCDCAWETGGGFGIPPRSKDDDEGL